MTKELCTPIHIKDSEDWQWPEDESAFYVLARSGLFLGRNHPFFRSLVRTDTCPSELAGAEAFLDPSYPTVPRESFELVVGFFSRIAELHNAEAGVLLVWDAVEQSVRIHVPRQVATVRTAWDGKPYPVGLHYETNVTLPPQQTVFGDVHSHVHASAYASGIDVHDEVHRPGLHIVVGRLDTEPPDLHVEAVVDRSRFLLEPKRVLPAYRARATAIPEHWISQLEVAVEPPYPSTFDSSYSSRATDRWWHS